MLWKFCFHVSFISSSPLTGYITLIVTFTAYMLAYLKDCLFIYQIFIGVTSLGTLVFLDKWLSVTATCLVENIGEFFVGNLQTDSTNHKNRLEETCVNSLSTSIDHFW